MLTVKLEEEGLVVIGQNFRIALAEDTANRQLILHLYTTAEALEPRPLTKFLKLGSSDINGQVVVLRAIGKIPEPKFKDAGGVTYL